MSIYFSSILLNMSMLNFLQRTFLALDVSLVVSPVLMQAPITVMVKYVGIQIVLYEEDSTWDKKVANKLIQRVDVKC